MKKNLSRRMLSVLLLLTIMAMSIPLTAVSAFAAAPASYTDIAVDQTKNVSVGTGGVRYFRFVPTVGGTYKFYSFNKDGDPYGHLLDAAGNELTRDDDSSDEGTNFLFEYRCEAGETYYLKARGYSDGSATYDVKIVAVELDDAPVVTPPAPTPVVDVWDGTVATGFGGGTGTEADPYLIYTAEQLAYLASGTNSGNTYSGKYFKLMNDIDLDNREWTPIGRIKNDDWFSGAFDGNFSTVDGLKITGELENAGLFGCVNNATIKNLAVVDANVDTYYDLDPVAAGVVCGYDIGNSVFSRIYVSGSVKAFSNKTGESLCVAVGLLLGRVKEGGNTSVFDCYCVGSVYGKMDLEWNAYVGGISGISYCRIERSYFNGSVIAEGVEGSYAGGISGVRGTIYNSFAVGTVTAKDATLCSAGGIVSNWDISTCVNSYYSAICSPSSTSYGTFTADYFKSEDWIEAYLGWDFDSVWTFDTESGYEYPVLRGFDDIEAVTPPPAPVVDVWDGTVATGFGGGTGTEADPYLIYTAEQLAYLASCANSGNTYNGKYFKLMNNIDLDNREWTPIGKGVLTSNVDTRYDYSFQGSFDGCFFTVSNLKITDASTSFTGLFGVVGGYVGNLGVHGAQIDVSVSGPGRSKCGALAGCVIDGLIEGCYAVEVDIRNETRENPASSGGLIGLLLKDAAVMGCYAQGSVSSVEGHAGVLVGAVYQEGLARIENCYAVGSVHSAESGYSGTAVIISAGIIAFISDVDSRVTVANCFFNGSVSSEVESGTISGNEYGTAGGIKCAVVSNSYYCVSGSVLDVNGASASADNFKSEDWIETNLGWDFDSVWTFDTESGYEYPVLRGFANTGVVEVEEAIAPTVTAVNGAVLEYGYTSGGPSVTATAAEGHALSYQWYVNTSDSNEGGALISGATSATYEVPTGKAGTTEYYYCVITATRATSGRTASVTTEAVAVTYEEEPIVVSGKILVIMDREPWGVHSSKTTVTDKLNEMVSMGTLEDWDRVSTSGVTTSMLSEYPVVYIANEQPTEAQARIRAMKSMLEEYVRGGGVLIYGFATMAGTTDEYGSALPGSVTAYHGSSGTNVIADASHPIITGMLSDGVALNDSDMTGSEASHDYIVASTLPEGSRVIITKSDGSPTLVEYSLGEGTVIATGMTWEFYAYSGTVGGLGGFAKKAYDDLLLYALSCSDGIVSPHTHVESEWIVDAEATCTAEGSKHKECTECGTVTVTEAIPTVDHVVGEWVIEREPTAFVEGLRSKYCTVCGAVTESEAIPVLMLIRVETDAENAIIGEEVVFTLVISGADPMKALGLLPIFDSECFEFVSAEWSIEAFVSNIEDGTLRSVAAWETLTDVNTTVYTVTLRAAALTDETVVDFVARLHDGVGYTEVDVQAKAFSIIECPHTEYVCGQLDGDAHVYTCTRCGHNVSEAHVYDSVCDSDCNICDYERVALHQMGEEWICDADGHWRECELCGLRAAESEHEFGGDCACDVCGYVRYLLGDVDNDQDVDSDDAVYLLYHVFFFEDTGEYPIIQRCDFNGNGTVDSDDAVYLLYHVFFFEDTGEYPLHDMAE